MSQHVNAHDQSIDKVRIRVFWLHFAQTLQQRDIRNTNVVKDGYVAVAVRYIAR